MIRNINRFLKIPDKETWSHLCQCRTADKGDVQVSHVDVNVNNDSLGKLFKLKISFYVGNNFSLTSLRCCGQLVDTLWHQKWSLTSLLKWQNWKKFKKWSSMKPISITTILIAITIWWKFLNHGLQTGLFYHFFFNFSNLKFFNIGS